ncbi:probable ubiquitin-like-specific protease 2A [Cucurbita pepo subsp. pepo]|uniref:probable ubiquitin-like-specific protease 2A n=1 Tax=Cucurbita pepo subsp. pepo TaxID=3664 RepID=UPI000C9D2CCA|nr:probable ubiquitin-like-specific protease 2A [Cucurbita pepo subsp. pepo]
MGKRKRPQPVNFIDLDQPTTGHGNRKKSKESENIETVQLVPPSTSDTSPVRRRKQSTTEVETSGASPSQKRKLDSRAFEYCFQNLWRSSPEEKKIQFTYLDCLWFSLYLKAAHRRKVLKWIKNKQIFSKKYVFVPIVCWSHWSLLIFCHFDEKPDSKTRKPCMLLLDSLQEANPRRLEPEIRKFVMDIFKDDGRCKNLKVIGDIPLMVPKVPQQKNGEECGKFVLYFIHLFMKAAPEKFSIKDYPYFMKENWFTEEGVCQFFKTFGHFEEDICL